MHARATGHLPLPGVSHSDFTASWDVSPSAWWCCIGLGVFLTLMFWEREGRNGVKEVAAEVCTRGNLISGECDSVEVGADNKQ